MIVRISQRSYTANRPHKFGDCPYRATDARKAAAIKSSLWLCTETSAARRFVSGIALDGAIACPWFPHAGVEKDGAANTDGSGSM